MTDTNYWLMKSEPVVIARVFENQINSVHTSSTHLIITKLTAMTEINYWLMKSEPVVIEMDLKIR